MLFWLGPAVLLVLLVRVLRPLVLIRFGELISPRIGHYSIDTELYLCLKDAGEFGPRTLDLFYHGGVISNKQMKKMWDRTLRVWPFVSKLDRVNRKLPGKGAHTVPIRVYAAFEQDMHALVGQTATHLFFTPKEEHIGQEALREMGIPEGAPFFCFHARDSAYLNASLPAGDWRYHDFRDSSIGNYIPAAEELARRGYYSLRMGAVVSETLDTDNPMIIDYASKFRSEFLDLYLSSKCRFFLGADSGGIMIPATFRRPLAFVNVIPLYNMTTWGPNDLSIPKKLWLREEERYMTYGEAFNLGTSGYDRGNSYKEKGIVVVENTSEEITALAVEMDQRLDGTWQPEDEDQELQSRFWSLYRSRYNHGPVVSRIGAQFLRDHRELLV